MAAREHVQLLHGPNCGCIVHRHERAEAAAKAVTAAPQPEPVARAPKVRKVKVSVVTNSGAVTNAARQSRWRSKQDVVELRGQAKERMKGLRARRKVGKAVGS
jgi:hypothetical protein